MPKQKKEPGDVGRRKHPRRGSGQATRSPKTAGPAERARVRNSQANRARGQRNMTPTEKRLERNRNAEPSVQRRNQGRRS